MRAPPIIALAALLAAPVAAAELSLTFVGIADDKAPLRIAVFADQTSFEQRQNAMAAFALPPLNRAAKVTLGSLPAGRYAIAVFQDITGDGKMHTNLIGMPAEPWGFSNDARGFMGPPRFDDAAVTLPETGLALTIRLHP